MAAQRRANLDARLLGGSAVFGWAGGIAGLLSRRRRCRALGNRAAPTMIAFVAAMLAGILRREIPANRCRARRRSPRNDPTRTTDMNDYPVHMDIHPEVQAFFDGGPQNTIATS